MDESELLKQRIQQLEKELASLRQDFSVASQELQIPMTPLKGFLRTLLDDENEELYTREDRHEFYAIINYNIDYLDDLIDDLPNASHTKKSRNADSAMHWQEDVDVHKVIASVIERQQKRTDRHKWALDFNPQPIFVEADPDKFAQICHNLISRAVRYAPTGSEIQVITRLEPPSEAYPVGALFMQIKDQGYGFDAETVQRQRFGGRRIKAPDPQHGGLLSIKNLVETHNGAFWVSSEGQDKGLTCNVRIPLKQLQRQQI